MYVGANKRGAVVPVGQKTLSGAWGREEWGQERKPSCVASGLTCSVQGDNPWPETVSRGRVWADVPSGERLDSAVSLRPQAHRQVLWGRGRPQPLDLGRYYTSPKMLP